MSTYTLPFSGLSTRKTRTNHNLYANKRYNTSSVHHANAEFCMQLEVELLIEFNSLLSFSKQFINMFFKMFAVTATEKSII